jgi:hypothetical protein
VLAKGVRPVGDAFPDFVVVLSPDTGGPYRTDLVTFDRDKPVDAN